VRTLRERGLLPDGKLINEEYLIPACWSGFRSHHHLGADLTIGTMDQTLLLLPTEWHPDKVLASIFPVWASS